MARLSPLTPLINSSILINTPAETTLVSARFQASAGPRYLVKSYLQRQDGSGTDDGEAPTFGSRSSSGGGMTSTWTFRGYAISYAIVSSDFQHGNDETGLTFLSILNNDATGLAIPLISSMKCTIRHGSLGYLHTGELTLIGGRYQGLGPDATIYYELQGVPMTLRAGFTH